MEAWFLFAIFSALTSGSYSFVIKISAENHNNPTELTFYSFLFSVIILIFLSPFLNIESNGIFWFALGLAFVNALTFYFGITTRVISLKNIDSAIYFPIYKTLGPLLVLLISLFIFGEELSGMEWIGIIVGITVPLLLLTKKENARQRNLKVGLFFLIIGTVCTVIAAWAAKAYVVLGGAPILFIVLTHIIATAFGYGNMKFKEKKGKLKKYSQEKMYLLSFLLGIFNLMTFYFYLRALEGNLAIVYTINSFSLLVPVLLSIVVYKEHFNLRKALAVVLSIVAIIFFG